MPTGRRRLGSRRDSEGDSVAQALERARRHARLALSEGVCAARALLDAASLSVAGERPEAFASLGRAARMLDDLSAGLSGEELRLGLPAFDAVLAALDGEITRWESRSQADPDARAVLRAFLGLREILWEFGLRRAGGEGSEVFGAPQEADVRTGAGAESGGAVDAERGRPGSVQRARVERRSEAHDPERGKSALPRVQHVKIQG
jgi:hypothetical protein